MRFRITGTIVAAVLLMSSIGCNGTDNYNMANANANANANMNANANVSTNANTATDTRRAPTREDYERDRERYEREARESGRKVGTGANDLWLWVKTRYELATVDDLRDSTIDVDVENGVVTLSGTVATAAQKTRAEQVAKAVEDVTSVRNNLRVAPDNRNSD